MNTKSNKTEEIQAGSEQNSVDKSKRSFSKAGMAAPILLSFASRPTWATSEENCSFRQALSGNISQDPNRSCTDSRSSTVSPGVFQGDGGGSKWEEYGVGIYRTTSFSSVFGAGQVTFSDVDDPSLEEVIKAKKKDFSDASSFSENALLGHYIAAWLMAMSPVLIYPYTASQIADDWGTFALYSNLKALHDKHLTVLEANDIVNFEY